MKWQPIETCHDEEGVIFAAYYKPSDEAAKNGSYAYWSYGIGEKYGSIFTGILRKPTHWMPLPPPPEDV